ncbi:DinB family protein, partial [Candidatus Gracilibacteria bacterium]|nr:DinB family protein [Candidatus Gracilibacteria bacterium]
MATEPDIISKLRAEFVQWEALLARLSEAEIVVPQPDGMSIKDVLAHLMAWQQVSIARLAARSKATSRSCRPGWA